MFPPKKVLWLTVPVTVLFGKEEQSKLIAMLYSKTPLWKTYKLIVFAYFNTEKKIQDSVSK